MHGFGARFPPPRKIAAIIMWSIIICSVVYTGYADIHNNREPDESIILKSDTRERRNNEIHEKNGKFFNNNGKLEKLLECPINLTFAQKILEDGKGNGWKYWEEKIAKSEAKHSLIIDMTHDVMETMKETVWTQIRSYLSMKADIPTEEIIHHSIMSAGIRMLSRTFKVATGSYATEEEYAECTKENLLLRNKMDELLVEKMAQIAKIEAELKQKDETILRLNKHIQTLSRLIDHEGDNICENCHRFCPENCTKCFKENQGKFDFMKAIKEIPKGIFSGVINLLWDLFGLRPVVVFLYGMIIVCISAFLSGNIYAIIVTVIGMSMIYSIIYGWVSWINKIRITITTIICMPFWIVKWVMKFLRFMENNMQHNEPDALIQPNDVVEDDESSSSNDSDDDGQPEQQNQPDIARVQLAAQLRDAIRESIDAFRNQVNEQNARLEDRITAAIHRSEQQNEEDHRVIQSLIDETARDREQLNRMMTAARPTSIPVIHDQREEVERRGEIVYDAATMMQEFGRSLMAEATRIGRPLTNEEIQRLNQELRIQRFRQRQQADARPRQANATRYQSKGQNKKLTMKNFFRTLPHSHENVTQFISRLQKMVSFINEPIVWEDAILHIFNICTPRLRDNMLTIKWDSSNALIIIKGMAEEFSKITGETGFKPLMEICPRASEPQKHEIIPAKFKSAANLGILCTRCKRHGHTHRDCPLNWKISTTHDSMNTSESMVVNPGTVVNNTTKELRDDKEAKGLSLYSIFGFI